MARFEPTITGMFPNTLNMCCASPTGWLIPSVSIDYCIVAIVSLMCHLFFKFPFKFPFIFTPKSQLFDAVEDVVTSIFNADCIASTEIIQLDAKKQVGAFKVGCKSHFHIV